MDNEESGHGGHSSGDEPSGGTAPDTGAITGGQVRVAGPEFFPANAPKKRAPNPRVLIAVAVVVVLLIVGSVLEFAGHSSSGSSASTTSTTTGPSGSTSPTKPAHPTTTTGGTPTTTASPVAALATAARTTVARQRAIDLLDEHFTTSAGTPVNVTGAGIVDFANNATFMAYRSPAVPALTHQFAQVIIIGDQAFVHGRQVATVLPGKNWISTTVSEAGQYLPIATNPVQFIGTLTTATNVTATGPLVINGVACTGYRVTLATTPTPAGGVMPTGSTLDVYVTNSTGLIRQLTATTSVRSAGKPVTASLVEEIEYPATLPRAVNAPPANQVATPAEFTAAGGSFSTS